jgi:hypothetical protein
MTFLVLGSVVVLFPGRSLHKLSLRAASSHEPIAVAPEGSSLDRCLPVNNPGSYATTSRS